MLKTQFNSKIMTCALTALFVVFLAPATTFAESGVYYGSGDSGVYYGASDSGVYYGGDSGAYYGGDYGSYYGGDSGTYYGSSPVSNTYYYDEYFPSYDYGSDWGYGCDYCGSSYPSYSGYGGGYTYTPSAGYDYIYNTNANVNTNNNNNANTNTITNTFNPTNNNDARINLVVYGGNSGTPDVNSGNTYTYNPSYSYNNGYNVPTYPSYVYQYYPAPQNTQSNITVIRDQNLGTPVSGVFLSQVPDTGISFGLKMTLFTLGLVLWSIFAAYMIARKKGLTVAEVPQMFADKVSAFKLNNMKNKGVI